MNYGNLFCRCLLFWVIVGLDWAQAVGSAWLAYARAQSKAAKAQAHQASLQDNLGTVVRRGLCIEDLSRVEDDACEALANAVMLTQQQQDILWATVGADSDSLVGHGAWARDCDVLSQVLGAFLCRWQGERALYRGLAAEARRQASCLELVLRVRADKFARIADGWTRRAKRHRDRHYRA